MIVVWNIYEARPQVNRMFLQYGIIFVRILRFGVAVSSTILSCTHGYSIMSDTSPKQPGETKIQTKLWIDLEI